MSPARSRDRLDTDAPSPMPPSRGQITGWLASTLALSAVFIVATVPNLARYPRVSGDDTWIMSASHKLATTGVFGSDLYGGFHDADRHYFIALPVYHGLQALSFTMFGSGIAQARAVTIASAIVVLWVTTWLALRWFGLLASMLSGLLLMFWRVDLVETDLGLPLLAVGRTGRYDMTAVAWLSLTIVWLDVTFRRSPAPSWWPPLLAGLCAGLATLTQFFGAFSILIVASLLLWRGGRRVLIGRAGIWIAAGFALVVVPYLAYVARHWADFVGQSAIKAGRTDFDSPSFYLDNLRDDGERYQHLFTPALGFEGVGGWLFVVTIMPVLGWLIWRCRHQGHHGERLLLATLVVPAAALALFDSTNAALYAIVLWPGCCVAVSAALASLVSRLRRQLQLHRHVGAGRALAASLAAVLVVVFALVVVGGVVSYRDDRRQANQVSGYDDIGRQLADALSGQMTVIGHERWWWALHERDYLALNALQQQWRQQSEDGSRPSFPALVASSGAGALVIDDNARDEIASYPATLQQQIAAFLATQTRLLATLTDPTYGRFDIFLIRR